MKQQRRERGELEPFLCVLTLATTGKCFARKGAMSSGQRPEGGSLNTRPHGMGRGGPQVLGRLSHVFRLPVRKRPDLGLQVRGFGDNWLR